MSNTRKTTAARKKRAAEAKDEAQLIVLEWDGETYEITSESGTDVEIYELIEDEHWITATRQLLGREHWQRWKDSQRSPDGRVPMERLNLFLDYAMKEIGQGNSSSSPGSSESREIGRASCRERV